MKQMLILMIFPFSLLSGCAKEEIQPVMPEEMPGDFDFKLQFGVAKRNGMDTYQDLATKDLIADGIASLELSLSAEEMAIIYGKMKEINIVEPKDLIPPTNCTQKPYSEDEWEITLNGETFHLLISEQFCETTEDAKDLIELRNYVFSFVKSKEEYQNLPDANGYYE
ncbi:hypothetical protein QMK38_03660 [Lysinibacillus fusiformis]|nr:hypothetical protein [Lysinibacillus fusiformis]